MLLAFLWPSTKLNVSHSKYPHNINYLQENDK